MSSDRYGGGDPRALDAGPVERQIAVSPHEIVRRVSQGFGKGQAALLVVDATGVVIVGIKGVGGLTQFDFKDHVFTATVHFSAGAEIIEGSYVLQPVEEEPPVRYEGRKVDLTELEESRLEIDGRAT